MTVSAATIPWEFRESETFSMWMWTTTHFKATIHTDAVARTFLWNIDNITSGEDQTEVLAEGVGYEFKAAENAIREIIGKSYDPTLGYRRYAGSFATTFTIFTGEKIDFGPLEAGRVIIVVRVLSPKTGQVVLRKITGRLKVINYKLELSPEHGNTLIIPPSHIMSVAEEYAPRTPASVSRVTSTGLRIAEGKVTRGCTGKPGSLPNTVEHGPRAPWCPIHNM